MDLRDRVAMEVRDAIAEDRGKSLKQRTAGEGIGLGESQRMWWLGRIGKEILN